uniref:Uncharacterized protein n=1 Tax=Amphimedon queenslandica TaxID=400682 RepID=A0A1X7TZF6_AMPQE
MAANGSQVEEYHSFFRSHHVYFTIWTPVAGEELVLRRQPDNEHDPYAVAVIKDEEVAGHVLYLLLVLEMINDECGFRLARVARFYVTKGDFDEQSLYALHRDALDESIADPFVQAWIGILAYGCNREVVTVLR